MTQNKKMTTFYLSDETREQLEYICKMNVRNKSNEVESLIRREYEKIKKENPSE